MNKVTVDIHGMEYNLKGEETEEYLIKLAKQVDGKIKKILSLNDKLSTASASILTAINATDEYFKAVKELEAVKAELSAAKDENYKSKEKIESLKNEGKDLKISLQDSKKKIIELQNKMIEEQIHFAVAKKKKNGA
ncbi:MAG: cell division protein ZapA [Bacillota bacterium]|nr:cell division protein ZapA [Bacillota bacterium]